MSGRGLSHQMHMKLASELAAARDEVERLRAGLRRFGSHSSWCGIFPSNESFYSGKEHLCTCGLDDLLRGGT